MCIPIVGTIEAELWSNVPRFDSRHVLVLFITELHDELVDAVIFAPQKQASVHNCVRGDNPAKRAVNTIKIQVYA